MITVITLTVTLVCSSISLFTAALDRSGSKLICVMAGAVATCGTLLVVTGGHWLWGIAGAMNLALIYLRYPVRREK